MEVTIHILGRLFFLLTCLQIVQASGGRHSHYPDKLSPESALISMLLHRYSKKTEFGRPVYNHSEAVPVRLGLQLIQIMDLDEKDQVLKLNVWSTYEWKDEFLVWDTEDYDGVRDVRLPCNKIWTPDVKLYNFADTRMEERREARCVVYFDGNVTWIPQAIYMSTCALDVTTFPFDKQECQLKFGSWTYNGRQLDLKFLNDRESMITDDYFVENTAWKVLATPAVRNVYKYACCPEPYYDLTFTLIFRRNATFYTYILILPCVLLTSLTLVLFWIPPESPTKMALGMSIYMAFFLLLLIFQGNMPPAARSIPILGTYYCLNMVLITMSTFLNVFVVYLAFYGPRSQVPRLLKKIVFQFCARILCMENLVQPFLDADRKRLIPPAIPGIGFVNGDGKWGKNWKGSSEMLQRKKDEIEIDPQLAEIDIKLTEIRDLLFNYRERVDEKDRKEKLAKEWKAVGLIFDRMFFTLYLVTILTSLAVVMPIIFFST